jgi:hypothetical protein
MSEPVVLQIITQLGTIIAAIVAAVSARSGLKKAKEAHSEARSAAAGVRVVKAETEANRGSSMRDAIDRIEANQQSEQKARERLETTVDGVASDVRGLRCDIGRLQDADTTLREDFAKHAGEVPQVVKTSLSEARKVAEALLSDHERRHH